MEMYIYEFAAALVQPHISLMVYGPSPYYMMKYLNKMILKWKSNAENRLVSKMKNFECQFGKT